MFSVQLKKKIQHFLSKHQLLIPNMLTSSFDESEEINYLGKNIICLKTSYKPLLDKKCKSFFSVLLGKNINDIILLYSITK
jgi:hypothetical protein